MSETQAIPQIIKVHSYVHVRLEITDRPFDGRTSPWAEYVRAEIVGADRGHLRVMIADECVVAHSYNRGDVLTVEFTDVFGTSVQLVPKQG